MLVLHAVWMTGHGAALWAEDSAASVVSPSQALRRARPHPYAAPADLLTDLIGGTPAMQTVLLPSLRRAPLDSPELVRITPRPSATTPPALLAWIVPTVAVTPSALGPALARLVRPDDESADGDAATVDVRPAASARYLLDLAEAADDLIDRGRVIPDLRRTEGPAEARWRAVLVGPDAARAQELIAAMPPSFRAADGESAPAALVTDALDTLADARARVRLQASFLPRRRGRRPTHPPVVEAWLDALTGDDPRMPADDAAIEALAEALQPWRAATGLDPGPANLVLRLTEPPTAPELPIDPAAQSDPATGPDPDVWRLDFLLRSRSDPSLLVDAERIWAGDGALDRWMRRPKEVLLAELGRAQHVWPGLEAGLRQARPSGLVLDTGTAFGFLTGAAGALDQAGFEVLLPSWWTKRPRLGLRARATPSDAATTEASIGRDQLVDFHWDLAVGDHSLSEDEIAALVEAKTPLVSVRGRWIAVDRDRLARAVDFLRSHSDDRATVADLLALAAEHAVDADLPLPVTRVDADGWLGDLLAGNAPATLSPVEPPEDFTATLRPYQGRGLSWLDFLGRLGLGACLADDMGLGKTVQLLALEATARARDAAERRPTLLLCPMSLIGNWQAEAARFAPTLRVSAHYGPERLHGDALVAAASAADVIVTTYATARIDIEDLAAITWERVVLDEAQAIKNRHARTAKAVRLLEARQRIALTGTPVENRLAELWSLMDVLNPGMLGSAETFRARFATPIERHHDEDATARLRRITRPYILRRLKTDPTIIDDLPEKMEIRQPYRLTVEQASLYQSVVEEMMRRIEGAEGIQRRGEVLAAMTKLKQVCNHPAQLLHDGSALGRRSGKITRLEEILEEILAEGDRVLCFTQFTEFAELLVPHLAARFDTDVAYLSGRTSRTRRTEMVERFQAGEGAPIFLLSLKAGGTGLNLTAANHVIHLDRWWNPAVENQATDRAFRIGQKQRVQVHKFVGTGTLEERIDDLIEEKKAIAELAVGDGESWLTELSTDRLRDLFTLSQEAVGE